MPFCSFGRDDVADNRDIKRKRSLSSAPSVPHTIITTSSVAPADRDPNNPHRRFVVVHHGKVSPEDVGPLNMIFSKLRTRHLGVESESVSRAHTPPDQNKEVHTKITKVSGKDADRLERQIAEAHLARQEEQREAQRRREAAVAEANRQWRDNNNEYQGDADRPNTSDRQQLLASQEQRRRSVPNAVAAVVIADPFEDHPASPISPPPPPGYVASPSEHVPVAAATSNGPRVQVEVVRTVQAVSVGPQRDDVSPNHHHHRNHQQQQQHEQHHHQQQQLERHAPTGTSASWTEVHGEQPPRAFSAHSHSGHRRELAGAEVDKAQAAAELRRIEAENQRVEEQLLKDKAETDASARQLDERRASVEALREQHSVSRSERDDLKAALEKEKLEQQRRTSLQKREHLSELQQHMDEEKIRIERESRRLEREREELDRSQTAIVQEVREIVNEVTAIEDSHPQ